MKILEVILVVTLVYSASNVNAGVEYEVIDIDDDARYHPKVFQSDETFMRIKKEYEEEFESEYWRSLAQNIVSQKIAEKLNTNTAKNVIMFLGDGMSLATVAAARIMDHGEEGFLSFEKFPHFGLSKTYCVDKQVADSACTATAYLNGVKANYGTIGVNANIKRYACDTSLDKSTHTSSIASWAQFAGKATGIVTTTRVTHASPAGTFAHIADRDWENNAKIKQSNCDDETHDDIAEQLILGDVGKKMKVIMGGGRREFLDATVNDEENQAGRRSDGKNLIQEWRDNRGAEGNATYVWNRDGLKSIDISKTDFILGLFENDHMLYQADVDAENLDTEPNLSEMVEVAIGMLAKEKNGYFLFVEGGRIDSAHHDTKARKSLIETRELAKALELARSMTNQEDTLIVVTSDHSHTMTIAGYPDRGKDILGLGTETDENNVPYLTLSYANGPGYQGTYDENGTRVDYSKLPEGELLDRNFEYSATVYLESETHGGDDVGVYASGPWSHLFVGNYEQNNIPMLMAYAAKIGEYYEESNGTAATTFSSAIVIIMSAAFLGLSRIFNS